MILAGNGHLRTFEKRYSKIEEKKEKPLARFWESPFLEPRLHVLELLPTGHRWLLNTWKTLA